MTTHKDKSLKISKSKSYLHWRHDESYRAVFDGHVVTLYGIVIARGDFSLESGYTRLEFAYRGRLYIREIPERKTNITAGREARKFAEYVAALGGI